MSRKNSNNRINFRNPVQAALFSCELVGQISDGAWENSRPYDHWKDWSAATVAVDENQLGRNFYTEKSNYDFTRAYLMEVCGDRMLNVCNMTENGISLSDVDEFNGIEKYLDCAGEYWDKKRERLNEVFGSLENYRKACKGSYDMKKMKKELGDMKKIVKMYRAL